MPTVRLTGTLRRPELVLTFDLDAHHAQTGQPLLDWVRGLPGRYFDPRQRHWVVTATGPGPDRRLALAGITVDLGTHPAGSGLEGLFGLDDLVPPLAKLSNANRRLVLVRPRLAGFTEARERLGPGAVWDRQRQRFEVGAGDLLLDGAVRPGIDVYDAQTLAAARQAHAETASYRASRDPVRAAAATIALSTGIDITAGEQSSIDQIIDVHGDIPGWFGLELYPYQRLGALSAAAGRRLISDSMGLGKTRTALAAAALTGSERVIVVCPPVVMTHWTREAVQSKITPPGHQRDGQIGKNPQAAPEPTHPRRQHRRDGEPDADRPDHVVMFRTGRKEPALPRQGVVIVSDSLLASRPELLARLRRWEPDLLIYDEAHRARTWTSTRSKTIRGLATGTPTLKARLALTGTPLFTNPIELVPLLEITGQLGPVFGGHSAFVSRYCRQNHFRQWVPVKRRLPELRRLLDDHVWVRRNKADVLTDLPPKARLAKYVDVDLAGFRAAHTEVSATIAEWVTDFTGRNSRPPGENDIQEYASGQIGLMSPLFKAAGLAKVPAAVDLVREWLRTEAGQMSDGTGRATFDRPLTVWVHHHDVMDAMAEAVQFSPRPGSQVGVISGRTSSEERDRLVEEFQAGHIGVLICSITAAGVGITLTRGCDALFLESIWSPSLVEQAEDRHARIGQTRPVSITTMVATGTLDERVQAVQANKAKIINAVTGSANADTSVTGGQRGISPTVIVEELARTVVERSKVSHR